MSAAEIPDPDRVEGAPHPRETTRPIGQEAAEAGFLALAGNFPDRCRVVDARHAPEDIAAEIVPLARDALA